jgi:hypothetical protein
VRARDISSPADLRQIRVGKKKKYPGFLLREKKKKISFHFQGKMNIILKWLFIRLYSIA